MPYCAVLECKNDSRTKNVSNSGISYHKFPKAASIKEKWIDATGRQNWFPAKTSTICSIHFVDQHFINKSGKRYLTDAAVPKQKIIQFQSDSMQNVAQRDASFNVGAGSSTGKSSLPKQRKHEDEATIKASSQKENILEITARNSGATPSPPKKRLREVLRWKENKINRQNLLIKRLKSRNRRLKNKLVKIEDILKVLEEKFCMVVENLQTNINVIDKILNVPRC